MEPETAELFLWTNLSHSMKSPLSFETYKKQPPFCLGGLSSAQRPHHSTVCLYVYGVNNSSNERFHIEAGSRDLLKWITGDWNLSEKLLSRTDSSMVRALGAVQAPAADTNYLAEIEGSEPTSQKWGFFLYFLRTGEFP